MRCAITRVLPEPGPARMSSAPLPATTARRWAGFSVSCMVVIASIVGRETVGVGRFIDAL